MRPLFFFLLAMHFLTYLNAQEDVGKSVDNQVKLIPPEDRKILSRFFKRLFYHGDFSYTLLGHKPMGSIDYNLNLLAFPQFYKNPQKHLYLMALDQKGWETWEKYKTLFPLKKYSFIKVSQGNFFGFLLINKEKVFPLIEEHLQAFQELVGEKICANKMLSMICNGSFGYYHANSPSLITYYKALGLLYGYGEENVKAFTKREQLVQQLKSFPAEIMYYGRDNLIEHYKLFYENNDKSNVKVVNRMTLKNVVIDEELVTLNNTTKRQVTIYETDDDEITTMTFIENSKLKKKQEVLINEQIEMYNKKDVKPYGRTFSTDVKVYDFPHELSIDGRPALRDQYISLVDTTPNLYAEIVNRIIIGNKVIDKIKTTINDTIEYTVAIYEIENGLISAVTYIK